MRYIDIDSLELPDGWHIRAEEALESLRQEVSLAEASAIALGEDPVFARKKAITDGLAIPSRAQIWQSLNSHLAKLSYGKCWYSESRNPTADKNVDHFRPKNRVNEDPDHEGYWWLAFQWRNYRYSSQWCNQRRVNDVNGTSGGKWYHFPLCEGSFRARLEEEDWELEEPELLDPIDPDDWKLLTFRQDGYPIPAKHPGTLEYERAATSIIVYHLDCNELVTERRALAGHIQRLIQYMETLRPKITDLKMKTLYKQQQKELLRAIRSDAEYSAAALAYARAEVYKLQLGRQVKREWLEDILNSNYE
jgi:uncharacterized protein (TIGR02646 family)